MTHCRVCQFKTNATSKKINSWKGDGQSHIFGCIEGIWKYDKTLNNFNLQALFTITKTYLYNFDLKPHFYIVKLGFTGVCIVFLFLLKNIDCGYPLEPPRRCGSNAYPQSMFWAIWNISDFFAENFQKYSWTGMFSLRKYCFKTHVSI